MTTWQRCSSGFARRSSFSEKCVRFCRYVDRTFQGWLERIFELQFRQELCEIFRQTCEESACENPAKLVDRVAKKLPSALLSCTCQGEESPSTGALEEIKEHLHALFTEQIQELETSEINTRISPPAPQKKSDLDDEFFLRALRGSIRRYVRRKKDYRSRDANRAYYAVGMIFAGDTPGSPFGEFAVASDIARLEKVLRFSLRPVFEPRSSFRELRQRPPGRGRAGQTQRSSGSLAPGAQGADLRGGGPQPDLEPGQSGPETGGG